MRLLFTYGVSIEDRDELSCKDIGILSRFRVVPGIGESVKLWPCVPPKYVRS